MDKFVVSAPTLPPFEEFLHEIEDIWESHILTHQGPKYQELEKQLARYLGVKHILLFANGHLALQLALRLFEFPCGEVITSPFTFASTTQAILETGLTPVFCDINPKTFTLDPDDIKRAITDKTRAILPVHVFGYPCDLDAIQKIADKNHLKVIYDAAHAFGVKVNNHGIGTFGDVSMFSFHATKVFNTVEGGALTFSDPEYYEQLAALRQFGQIGDSYPLIGTNAKLSEFHAAMGLCNLRYIDSNIKKRAVLARTYDVAFKNSKGLSGLPPKSHTANHAYYPILIDSPFSLSRDEVAVLLAGHGIVARKYFSPLTSSFACCEGLAIGKTTPIADYVEKHILCLPLHTELEISDVQMIAQLIVSSG